MTDKKTEVRHPKTLNVSGKVQRARSHIPRDVKDPCEGGQASPSNPTGARKSCAPKVRRQALYVEFSDDLKVLVRERAVARRQNVSTFVRELVTGAELRRPRPVPLVDPELIRAVGRYGGNLNQLMRWLNTEKRAGTADKIEMLRIRAALVGIERQLGKILDQHMRSPKC